MGGWAGGRVGGWAGGRVGGWADGYVKSVGERWLLFVRVWQLLRALGTRPYPVHARGGTGVVGHGKDGETHRSCLFRGAILQHRHTHTLRAERKQYTTLNAACERRAHMVTQSLHSGASPSWRRQ
jgi:hypothetical protein